MPQDQLMIVTDRDYNIDYFGFKNSRKKLSIADGEISEMPQEPFLGICG